MAGEQVTELRDMIAALVAESRRDDLSLLRASQMLLEVSALFGNVNTEIRDAEATYNLVHLAHLRATEKANHARIAAMSTEEYRHLCELKDLKELLGKVEGALKYTARALTEDARFNR